MPCRLLVATLFSTLLALTGCTRSSSGGGTSTTCDPACPAGTSCVDGVCQCSREGCPSGCCKDQNTCLSLEDQSNDFCGTGGVACGSCGGKTPTCTAGVCTDACGEAGNGACQSGCCGGGHCLQGDEAASCGTGGGLCVDCPASAVGKLCTGGRCGCSSDGDCPPGISCHLATGTCSCGPANCQGCCDPTTGACVTPSSAACGSGGATCAACAPGQSCASGSCGCDPSSCDGCCSNGACIPAADESASACGTGGAACGGCAAGQSCSNGQCVCDASSCPNGCCAGGLCVPLASQTAASCGKGGAACTSCSSGQACAAGSCTCDATSCAGGCCDASGQCQPGSATAACGTGGAACASCAAGQACAGGACACNAASCPSGCCDASGQCQPGSATAACGGGGAACASCATGQACASGACVCNAASCPNGCCNGNTCVPYASQGNGSCGTAGAACAACGGLTPTCAQGACTGACGAAGNGTCASGCCTNGSCVAGSGASACGGSGGACVDCTLSAVGHVCRAGVCGCSSSADCPSGQTCNTTSHTCGACNATTCPSGCCDGNGQCQAGTGATACGTGGQACASCATGQACAGGACVCNAASCPSGCCNGNTCVPFASQSATSCGSGGASCGSCASASAGAACVSGHCGCTSAAQCAAGSVCATASSTCVAGGACSAGACRGCCSGGTCVAGGSAGACGMGGGACVDCVAGTPTCQSGAACTNSACSYTASTGGSCSTQFCTVGQTCSAGSCGGGTPRDCTGGDACKSCSCSNAGAGACNCTPRSANAGSSLTVSASCLTAGSGARLVAVLKLVDAAGTPATGAQVTFSSSNAAATWVEPAAVEVANPPGTYYRTLKAPASTGSTTVSASVAFCSASTAITATQTVSFAQGAPETGGANPLFAGVRGCTPIAGHLRVKVLGADTGQPLAGASVLVGSVAGTPFVSGAAQLFPSAAPSGANTGTTDANGVVEFLDLGGALAGPQVVTAGASGYAYATYYHFNGDDQVLVLERRQPAGSTYRYTAGTATPVPTRPDCTWVQAGFAIGDTTLNKLSRFELSSLVGPNKCVSVSLIGNQALPENIYAPQQSLGTVSFLCLATLTASPWSLSIGGGSHVFSMPFVRLPVSAVQGGQLVDMIKGAVFQSIGYQSANVTGDGSGTSVALHASYANGVTYNFSNAPAQTDVVGLALVDYSGKDGTGQLGINGIQVHKYSDTGSSVVVKVADTTGAPAGTRYLGAVVASYLDPVAPRTPAADLASSKSAVFVRGTGTTPPFSSTANTTIAVSNFLGQAPVVVGGAGTQFTFGDASNAGQTPQYSVSTLVLRHATWLPQQSCEDSPGQTNVDRPQWVVTRPQALDGAGCASLSTAPASCESFTLPTLPAGFPEATAGAQKQAGFEARVGSGAACTTGCPVAGEVCQVPTGSSLPTQCMGQDAGGYFTESYTWILEDRVLGNLPPTTVTAGSADLTQSSAGLTQVSSNVVHW